MRDATASTPNAPAPTIAAVNSTAATTGRADFQFHDDERRLDVPFPPLQPFPPFQPEDLRNVVDD